ncbi:MAG: anthranilate synthase component I family protein [Nitrospirales bacterium]
MSTSFIRPSRARFLLEEHPEPLILELPCPRTGLFDLYGRLATPDRPSFLLESGKGTRTVARYSFFGADPFLVLSGRGSRTTLRWRDRTEDREADPFTVLTEMLRASRVPRPEDAPPFFGGAVGYLGYDVVRTFERVPTIALDDLTVPEVQFAFVDLVAALDHDQDTLYLVFAPPLARLLGEPREKLYREGADRLAELEATLTTRVSHTRREPDRPAPPMRIAPEQTREAYMERVARCQDYIRAGDIYQANLSHRFTVDLEGPPTSLGRQLYARLRRGNPSPFAGLLTFPPFSLVSSSPERLVRLQGMRADTRPIAGTRPRGTTLADDRRLVEELLGDSKERAEHLMLVDLARNDVGRVCRYGTVRVDDFMAVERYSHVSHLVSNVTGELREDVDGFDLLRAVFPGGTITGVPKIHCLEIIETLEPVRRGPYTGAMGYLSWSGDLDFNILIRTVLLTAGRGYLQVGAGIVADSDPAREYDETLYKAEALLAALRGGQV